MSRIKSYDEVVEDYKKNIKINIFFNENGQDIKALMKEIVLSNCNPVKMKKSDF